MDHPLRRIDVLRHLELAHAGHAERAQARRQAVERVTGVGAQLPRLAGVAQVVRRLAEEADAATAHMQAGPHPVAVLWRARDRDTAARQREPSDAAERVLDDQPLHLELARVVDMCVDAAATERVAGHGAPVSRRLIDGHHLGVGDTAANALDSSRHLFTGDGAGHEHNLAVGARYHAPAGGRLLDGE